MKKFKVLVVLLVFLSIVFPVFAETTILKQYVKTQLQLEEVATIARDYIRSEEAKVEKAKAKGNNKLLLSILLHSVYYVDGEKGGLWYIDAICESGSHYTICIDERNISSWFRRSDRHFDAGSMPRRENLPKWKK